MIRKWFILITLAFLVVFSMKIPSSSAAGSKFIIINKANNQLAYYQNSKLTKVFKVGTGRSQNLTPEGKFKVVNKIKNRPYYTDNIPGGDPRNPLGNRWLGLNARGTWGSTYAIHGNNNPGSIGGYVSAGCVRMYDEEVEWLFDQVSINTTVIITDSRKSFDSIASAYGFNVKASHHSVIPAISYGITLRKGSRGPDVLELQRKLTTLGFNTMGIDGAYGPNTEKAVKKFQRARGLSIDGVVGPNTRKALGSSKAGAETPFKEVQSTKINSIIRMGSRGIEVKTLQHMLTASGYNTRGVDGIFGSNTYEAVRQFQKAKGLQIDGIVGPNTRRVLEKR